MTTQRKTKILNVDEILKGCLRHEGDTCEGCLYIGVHHRTEPCFSCEYSDFEERSGYGKPLSTRTFNDYVSWMRSYDDIDEWQPDECTLGIARAWVTKFEKTIMATSADWDIPHITTGVDPAVTFEWWSADRTLTVFILNESIEYLKFWGSHIDTEMQDGDVTGMSHMIRLWDWLNYK